MQQRELAVTFGEQGVDASSLHPLFHLHNHLVYVLTVPRAQALDRWAMLRALVHVTHY